MITGCYRGLSSRKLLRPPTLMSGVVYARHDVIIWKPNAPLGLWRKDVLLLYIRASEGALHQGDGQ